MVKLNRIYTRTGDDGTTGLGNGERRPKNDARVAAYGDVDEANSAIGLARRAIADSAEADLAAIEAILARAQNDLFDLGADLCVPESLAEHGRPHPEERPQGASRRTRAATAGRVADPSRPFAAQRAPQDEGSGISGSGSEDKPARPPLRMAMSQVDALELAIDALNAHLSPLRSFVLPGGSRAAGALHLARAICRRAERAMVALAATPGERVGAPALAYINRLSDYLFVAARFANERGGSDVLWAPGAGQGAQQ